MHPAFSDLGKNLAGVPVLWQREKRAKPLFRIRDFCPAVHCFAAQGNEALVAIYDGPLAHLTARGSLRYVAQ